MMVQGSSHIAAAGWEDAFPSGETQMQKPKLAVYECRAADSDGDTPVGSRGTSLVILVLQPLHLCPDRGAGNIR
jgi:hypothetical protein